VWKDADTEPENKHACSENEHEFFSNRFLTAHLVSQLAQVVFPSLRRNARIRLLRGTVVLVFSFHWRSSKSEYVIGVSLPKAFPPLDEPSSR